jgi:anti-sigma regulatory factor (Ser/Thr protein kinase)
MEERSSGMREGGLHIAVPAQPENVSVVRQAIATRAEKLGMTESRIDDLKIAVSEACANVVLHAYEDRPEPGPLEVELTPGEGELSVVVRDFGGGILPRISNPRSSLRMGLALIGVLSSRFQLTSTRGQGTEIRIQLPLSGRAASRECR